MSRIAACVAAVALLGLCGKSSAQTLYKHVDKDGKVTYSEVPPLRPEGRVEKIGIDRNANTFTAPARVSPPKGQEAASESGGSTREEPRPAGREEKIRIARAKMNDARKAFEQARDNPGEGDFNFVAGARPKCWHNPGQTVQCWDGGTRGFPTAAFTQRLAAMQAEIAEAEAQLRALERDLFP